MKATMGARVLGAVFLGASALAGLARSGTVSAELPTTETLEQRAGTTLETFLGGKVFRIKRTAPLPNAFGRADIFGRKVDRGYLELRFQGLGSDGRVSFRVIEVETQSNESTMTRTPIVVTQTTASGQVNPVDGSVSVQGRAVSTVGPTGETVALPPNTTEFAVDPATTGELRFGAVAVRIIAAEPTALRYSLTFDPGRSGAD
jgi:hypothetical protein